MSIEANKWQKMWFWVKIGGLVLAVIALVFLGIKSKALWHRTLVFFGFAKKKQNLTVIGKITKVDTGQDKTKKTIEFIQEMRKQYMK